MKRNKFLDFAKGILILLVCIGHANQHVVHLDHDFWQDPLFKTIYMFHMPLFMAIAGYFSYQGINNSSSMFLYLKKRLISYLLPIFSWAVILQVAAFCFNHTQPNENVLFLIARSLPTLWFLWAILWSVILSAFANLFGKYRLLLFLIIFIFTLLLPDRSILLLFKYIFPFFVIGFYCNNIDFSQIQPSKRKIAILFLFIASSVCFFFWEKKSYIYVTGMRIFIENIQNIIFRWIAGVIVSAFFILLLYYIFSSCKGMLNRMFVVAGRNSIYIYILQVYLLDLIIKPLTGLFPSRLGILFSDLTSVIVGFMLTFICLSIGFLLSINKYTALILFGKVK